MLRILLPEEPLYFCSVSYVAVRGAFINAFAGSVQQVLLSDETIQDAVKNPLQSGYHCTKSMVFDKVKRLGILLKWMLLFKVAMGHKMVEGDVLTILIEGDPFWLIRTSWKRDLEIVLGWICSQRWQMMKATAKATAKAIWMRIERELSNRSICQLFSKSMTPRLWHQLRKVDVKEKKMNR